MGFFDVLGKIIGGVVDYLDKEAQKPQNIVRHEAMNEVNRLKGLSSEERRVEANNRKDRLKENNYGYGVDSRINRDIDKMIDKAYSNKH